jgi:hypothetical protein
MIPFEQGNVMFFWIRELAGWGLIALSMVLANIALMYVGNRQVVEAALVGLILLSFFKGGILLIRISTAARIAMKS